MVYYIVEQQFIIIFKKHKHLFKPKPISFGLSLSTFGVSASVGKDDADLIWLRDFRINNFSVISSAEVIFFLRSYILARYEASFFHVIGVDWCL